MSGSISISLKLISKRIKPRFLYSSGSLFSIIVVEFLFASLVPLF